MSNRNEAQNYPYSQMFYKGLEDLLNLNHEPKIQKIAEFLPDSLLFRLMPVTQGMDGSLTWGYLREFIEAVPEGRVATDIITTDKGATYLSGTLHKESGEVDFEDYLLLLHPADNVREHPVLTKARKQLLNRLADYGVVSPEMLERAMVELHAPSFGLTLADEEYTRIEPVADQADSNNRQREIDRLIQQGDRELAFSVVFGILAIACFDLSHSLNFPMNAGALFLSALELVSSVSTASQFVSCYRQYRELKNKL